ncbi:hypothetical protein CCMSSC00406_0004749 [Pleurotus cornucopiae]|uniref:Uncharacterized protein n=1 Tax=Pleurotus cornucopiae TaxID=5321 RepID=A0ACB7J2L6_PLECO|nr:hypothetical protein CCMSSC00406_0004749 [Pleurotus cornucopiae]
MPSLPPDLCGLYKDAHKDVDVDSIRLLEDQDGTTTHGVKWIPSKTTTRDFQHLPRHDAESVYWVIVVFLLRAIPRGHSPEEDENRDQLAAAWNLISSHEIKSTLGALASDVRGTFFWSPGIWSITLHRELVCLAPMMLELGEQVAPEYEYLQSPPDPFHLHEAMQRILLKYAVQFTGDADIPLNTEESRVILVPKDVPDLRASTEVSLDGQHLQLAGRRSHLSASQGTYISGHKRKRSESIVSDSAASSWVPSKPLRWIAKLLRGNRQPEQEDSDQPPEDVVEKRRRKH